MAPTEIGEYETTKQTIVDSRSMGRVKESGHEDKDTECTLLQSGQGARLQEETGDGGRGGPKKKALSCGNSVTQENRKYS